MARVNPCRVADFSPLTRDRRRREKEKPLRNEHCAVPPGRCRPSSREALPFHDATNLPQPAAEKAAPPALPTPPARPIAKAVVLTDRDRRSARFKAA